MDTHDITITTPSMTPTIPVGTTLRYGHAQPQPGDVAAFLAQGKPMVHRVLARWETRLGTFYIHKGDASTQSGVFRDHELLGTVLDIAPQPPTGWTALRLWFVGLCAKVYGEVKGRPELAWFESRAKTWATTGGDSEKTRTANVQR